MMQRERAGARGALCGCRCFGGSMFAISISICNTRRRLSTSPDQTPLLWALEGTNSGNTVLTVWVPQRMPLHISCAHELHKCCKRHRIGGTAVEASELSYLQRCRATSGSTIKQDASSPASGQALSYHSCAHSDHTAGCHRLVEVKKWALPRRCLPASWSGSAAWGRCTWLCARLHELLPPPLLPSEPVTATSGLRVISFWCCHQEVLQLLLQLQGQLLRCKSCKIHRCSGLIQQDVQGCQRGKG